MNIDIYIYTYRMYDEFRHTVWSNEKYQEADTKSSGELQTQRYCKLRYAILT